MFVAPAVRQLRTHRRLVRRRIEWNLGSTGHSATTSRPVFAGSLASSRGPALRIWEWERTRDLVFSVDLVMPSDRPLLLAFVRVRNPDPEPKPLYWWTNIAAAEEPGVRVLAPAAGAWRTTYDGAIAHVDIPFAADDPASDISYPLPAQRAADYFFQVPPAQRPWIAAVQADGHGLVQTSTAQLRGRKLFLWGAAAAAGTGRSGCAGRGLATWRSRPVWPRRNSSTCGWARRRDQLGGGLRTDRSGAEGGTRSGRMRWPRSPRWWQGRFLRKRLDAWHRWWRAEVADEAPQQLTAGSGAGEAELVVRGEDPDGLPGTPFGQPLSDGFRHVALARPGKIDQDARWVPMS